MKLSTVAASVFVAKQIAAQDAPVPGFISGQSEYQDFEDFAVAIPDEMTLEARKFNHIINMAFTRLEDHPNFLPLFQFGDKRSKRKAFTRMMMNYGCHCFPSNKSTVGGKGTPVDELDDACRTLYKCHKCVDIEHDSACQTDNGDYRYEIDPSDNSVTCTNDINKHENAQCKIDLCECESKFVDNIYDIWVGEDSTWSYNSDFWLDSKWVKNVEKGGQEIFDREGTCVITYQNIEADQCCGEFPNIVPYSSSEKNCCANGEVRPSFVPCDDFL